MIAAMTARKFMLIAVLYFFGLVVATMVIHELGHFIMALITGVPINEIKFEWYGINPSLIYQTRFSAKDLFVYYAGGFTAALMLFWVYLFYWYRKYRTAPSVVGWALGAFTILTAGFQ